jgi:hypothetical protein
LQKGEIFAKMERIFKPPWPGCRRYQERFKESQMADEMGKPTPPQAGEESAPPPAEQREPLATPKVTYDPKAYWWIGPLLIAVFLGLVLLPLVAAGWYFRERIPVIAGLFTTPTPTLTATLPLIPTLPPLYPYPAPSTLHPHAAADLYAPITPTPTPRLVTDCRPIPATPGSPA